MRESTPSRVNAETSRNTAKIRRVIFLKTNVNRRTSETLIMPLKTLKTILTYFFGRNRLKRQLTALPPSSGYAGKRLTASIAVFAENTVSV